ncbi:protein of unknown function [Trichlorobacter ammonificans]|uniref:Uncharacterized protein n=1 Tax=Trichlorobacter ammonificans TaxID=2916410 RepID=A0ABM9D7Y2_9BACT|nr:protein of unknown function [Trichlorobacter ammonificans]
MTVVTVCTELAYSPHFHRNNMCTMLLQASLSSAASIEIMTMKGSKYEENTCYLCFFSFGLFFDQY